jgi:hypothetical protein
MPPNVAIPGATLRIHVINQSIHLVVSDDHRLPSTAAKALYARDNVARLKVQKILEGRVHSLINDIDADWKRIDKNLDGFIENVVRPYKAMANLGTCSLQGSDLSPAKDAGLHADPSVCSPRAPSPGCGGIRR